MEILKLLLHKLKQHSMIFKNLRLEDPVYVNTPFNNISLLGKPTKILMTHPALYTILV